MLNILIVDYSALMRRKMCAIIDADSDFHVADMCATGEDAYNKIMNTTYDLVIVDVAIPNDSGMKLIKQLQKSGFSSPIIVISTDLREDRESTVYAMELGAYDFISRPPRINIDDDFAKKLLYVMHAAADAKPRRKSSEFADSVAANASRTLEILKNISAGNAKQERVADVVSPGTARTKEYSDGVKAEQEIPMGRDNLLKAKKKKLIALACSTGGPQALHAMIPMLPASMSAPMVLVQHMPEGFTAALAERLDQNSAVHVKEAEEGDVLKAGWVYIAPGGKHMEICENRSKDAYVHISDAPPVNSLKPCADVMYQSLHNVSYDEIVCVVLTGMGADGTKGISGLKKHKPIYCISESEETCVVYGMPKSVVKHNLSDEEAPINRIADAIIKKLGE